ncbi:MAG TPA: threonine synthase [Phycisphaerae bacterium]|jgi:threonine synthase|nr:threonine synthase [Phycisphaerae bacterium]HOB73640.1 threonine synthase [Phycisphaerae bacterium]HOJ54755.1 threonine synthase [Phycisphaerae bacterium]HPU31953.1 threonine synthase [Phycisphaerae bacterium]HQA46435.1 threonine synthase [Phycisphaerae bacterium]
MSSQNFANTTTDKAFQVCINPDCGRQFSIGEVIFSCPSCGSLLDVEYDWDRLAVPGSMEFFEHRWSSKGLKAEGRLDFSGVWRFRELLPFAPHDQIVTIGEGRTLLEECNPLAREIGMKPGRLFLQYEGLNPSGSFKDNGMTAAFTLARMLGRKRVACASTGNTSASLAMFAHKTDPPMQGIVFIGSGKIAYGKLSQALDYGALTLQIEGDFDACLRRVRQVSDRLGIYLMNSVNPYRLEGQKAIMYRVLEAMNWQVPDWIIVPGGNLGNCSAFGKAFRELKQLGLVNRVPRLAVINAHGANTLYHVYERDGVRWNGGRYDQNKVKALYAAMDEAHFLPHTVASAIEIARPVNLPKALRALDVMNGVVREVTDEDILEHKALVGKYGFGCEPASAASVTGLRQLIREGVVSPDERVVCILTGHELKDPDATVMYHTGINMKAVQPPPAVPPTGRCANPPRKVADDLQAICAALGEKLPD